MFILNPTRTENMHFDLEGKKLITFRLLNFYGILFFFYKKISFYCFQFTIFSPTDRINMQFKLFKLLNLNYSLK